MNANGASGDALRVRTFDTPQNAAATRTSANAPSGPEPPSSTAATAMPASATTMPTTRTGPGRSRRKAKARTAVKTDWTWRTSEDRPAGIPAFMPTKSSPNLPTPSASPTPTTQRHATRGRPTRKIAGSAASRKRRAQKSSGGRGVPPAP